MIFGLVVIKGTNWSQVIVNDSHWSGRHRHQAFAYDNKLWVLGGKDSEGGGRQNDIWYSGDKGINWSQIVINDSHWITREGHQALVHNDKLWVLGGFWVAMISGIVLMENKLVSNNRQWKIIGLRLLIMKHLNTMINYGYWEELL